ncbi:hypothetical protein GCM10023205_62500 [Yinghuangia aomiensis]|uniref:Leucine-binding protein domain-containing protein n=1 Tax=Yinghuangia aomiensis TaxID=676205 RepID=A0ABP9I1D1_9ACTN
MSTTTYRALRRHPLPVAALAVVLFSAACTADGHGPGDGAPTPGKSSASSVAEVAPGVTADTVKIGVVYPDLTAVKQFLKIDHGDYEATYNALIKEINDAGGINGRRIVPVYGAVDMASPAAAQQTCARLTQDEKVFAVIGTFNGREPLCYVQTNRTAIIGGPLTGKNGALAQAPWFSFDRGGEEVGDAMGLFADGNALAGKKVAVVGVVNEEGLVKDTVLPALQRLGVTPVETGILDVDLGDTSAVGQQIGAFIAKFQAAGADTVVVVGGMSGGFPQALERTKYRPRLLFAPLGSVAAYTGDAAKHDFSTLAGAAGLGIDVRWNEPGMQRCVATMESAVPALRGKLSVDPLTLPAGAPSPQSSLQVACQGLALFRAIAEKAGRSLTYRSFRDAGNGLGAFAVPGYADKARYSATTPHGAVPARLWRYDPSARKFVSTQN